jgi:TonB-linked SusC/RagA family outer membrane protein
MKQFDFISDAKLRTSYGVTGNNRVSDFAYLSTLNFGIVSKYAFGNVYNTGAVPAQLGNYDLRWETTAQTDVGLDLNLFNNKLQLTADYYRKVTSNLLLEADVPPSTGFNTAFQNVGKVSNFGWEFELSSTNISKPDFRWNTSFNISFNRNKVLGLSRNQQARLTTVAYDTGSNNHFPYIAKIGGPIAQFYGYQRIGNYQYADFDLMPNGTYVLKSDQVNTGAGRQVIRPGDSKFADLDGNGVINANDRTVIGNPNPDFIGGLSNNFTYKGFDLNVFIQGSYGNDVLNANKITFENGQIVNANQFASTIDRWTPTNQTDKYSRALGGGPTALQINSRLIEDGSYIRLKTVALGYTLPSGWLTRARLKTARLYVSGQNLVTLTKYEGSDPEVSTRNSALTPGFDIFAYPRPRTFTFGFNFTF